MHSRRMRTARFNGHLRGGVSTTVADGKNIGAMNQLTGEIGMKSATENLSDVR